MHDGRRMMHARGRLGGMMDGAYACRGKGGLRAVPWNACLRADERGTHSTSPSPLSSYQERGEHKQNSARVINTQKMASAWLACPALPAGGGARMHASTSDLCFFLLGFSGAPNHRSPLCTRILYACSVITPVVKSFLASRCSAPGAGLIRAACTSRRMRACYPWITG